MFQGKEEIRSLVSLFKQRGVRLYHACQFIEFHSYLTVGGIPSHACLERRGLTYNPMVSDDNDRRNGVWDKVFVNLQDYGEIFANGRDGMPNAYGPILFKISPEAFLVASEVAITLRSAGAFNFDRQQEALCSMDEVERLFCYSSGPLIRFGSNLRLAFPERSTNCVESTEIHCVYPDGYLPLEYVESVLVDPYQIKGKYLQFFVDNVRSSFRIRFGISTRVARDECRQRLYNELGSIFLSSILSKAPIPTLDELIDSSSVSCDMQEWAQRIFERNIAWQFDGRFAPYLCNATLRPVLQLT
jgi:hypothetical protein